MLSCDITKRAIAKRSIVTGYALNVRDEGSERVLWMETGSMYRGIMCVYALLSGHTMCCCYCCMSRCSGTDSNIKCAYAICMRERERKLHTVSYQRFCETNPLRRMEFSGSVCMPYAIAYRYNSLACSLGRSHAYTKFICARAHSHIEKHKNTSASTIWQFGYSRKWR